MNYRESTLLSTKNHKTIKGEGLGYKTFIMYLSPYNDNSKGINLCPHASKGCSAACLFKSGNGGMYQHVANGRRNKTEWFLSDKKSFMAKLDKEISAMIKKHSENAIPVFRLNGTSDIRFEKITVRDNKNIFELYPDVQFYDYTKNPKRFTTKLPANYHLTFSRSEDNSEDSLKLLSKGYNVAMVFNKVPSEYMGYKVIVGDNDDLRFLDDKGVIVGLKYKNNTGKNANNKIAFETGFAITL